MNEFQAMGPTFALVSGAMSSNIALLQPVPSQTFGPTPLVAIYNSGTTDAFLAFGADNTVEAAVPVPGTPGGFPVPAGKSTVVEPPPGAAFVASIGGDGTLFLTQGF